MNLANLAALKEALSNQNQLNEALALLERMAARAAAEIGYESRFLSWLERGGARELRDLSEPFGSYSSDLHFATIVDSIDSARANTGS